MRKGELIEVVDGIEIRRKPRADADPLALVAGRRGRLEPKGPVYEVDRIGQGAAYIHRVYDPPVIKEWGDSEARDAAVEALLEYVRGGKDDGSSARRLTQEALRAAAKVKRIEVSRGPCEPGISKSARFVERVSDGPIVDRAEQIAAATVALDRALPAIKATAQKALLDLDPKPLDPTHTTEQAAELIGVAVAAFRHAAKTAGVEPKAHAKTGKRGRPAAMWTDAQVAAIRAAYEEGSK